MREVYKGDCRSMNIWYVSESGDFNSRHQCCLRPVVSLNSMLCKFSYDGTKGYFTVASK